MATSKWIKGLIFILGGLILSTLITWAGGGVPNAESLKLLGTALVTAIAGYIAKPPQNNPNPFGSINWKDFWNGMIVTMGAVIGPLVLSLMTSFPKTMAEWWAVIGIVIGYFAQYILKSLFTNANGEVLKP